MKYIFLLFLFSHTILFGNYINFIQEQMEYAKAIDDSNDNQEQIQQLLDAQKKRYGEEISSIIIDPHNYFVSKTYYESKIFTLKKVIKINKRLNNSYAVLRDQVKIKSYKLLLYQNDMLKQIFLSEASRNKDQFFDILNQYVVDNQIKNQKILEMDYTKYLLLQDKSRVLKQLQKNIKELMQLGDINKDIVNYLYIFEDKIFRLKKYAQYHLVQLVVKIDSYTSVISLNSFLQEYRLSVVKIFFIVMSIVLTYIINGIIFLLLQRYLFQIKQLKDYIKEMLLHGRKVFGFAIWVINLNLVFYIYNDFSNSKNIEIFFNSIYIFLTTLLMYKLLNIFLRIYIQKIDTKNKHIKHEVVNISIKALNAFVILIGTLLILHISGVDLTAVLSGLGIGGLAVALASKDSLANFFGTLSILLSDVFSQGDWIEVNEKEGVVVEIGLRITTIRTFDNALISIPNATFANQNVINWNKRVLGRRIKMKLGIRYDSKVTAIQNTIEDIRTMLLQHPDITSPQLQYEHHENKKKLISQDDYKGIKKTLLVYLDSFESSSINILVYCFSKSVVWDEWLAVKEDIMYKIIDIFEKNNIEFAYDSLSLYHEK